MFQLDNDPAPRAAIFSIMKWNRIIATVLDVLRASIERTGQRDEAHACCRPSHAQCDSLQLWVSELSEQIAP